MTLYQAGRAFRGALSLAPLPAPTEADAWSAFWGGQGAQGLCRQMAGEGLKQTLGIHWAMAARRLPLQERVLDLGCGAGVVGRLMLVERSDLVVHGVDSAEIPLGKGKGPIIHSGVSMEALPFADASFGAAVSQFGFEYGDPQRTALELTRVLRPGAPFSFLVHHRHSAIVAANAARRAALSDLRSGSLRRAFVEGEVARFPRLLRRLAAEHGAIDIVRELAGTLPLRLNLDRPRRAAIWQAIDDALAPEALILDALLGAAPSPQSLAHWLAPLRAAFTGVEAAPVAAPDGALLAWHVSGMRGRRTSCCW